MSAPRAIFLGSKAFGLSVYRALAAAAPEVTWTVVHPEDSGDGRSVLADFTAVVPAADFHIVASRAEAAALIAATDYDLGFVCGWYWLLTEAEVGAEAAPLYGIHNSLLPAYRGGAPLVWAMIDGVAELGSTLFRLTSGMDDGPVVTQVRHALGPEETIADVTAAIEAAYLAALPGLWPAIVAGTAPGAMQDEAAATYSAQRRPEDGRINWQHPAADLHNFIRAQSAPYPGAFTHLDGSRITIDRARPFEARYACRPGQILRRSPQGVLVGCGDSTALWVLAAHDDADTHDLATLFAPARGRILGQPGDPTP